MMVARLGKSLVLLMVRLGRGVAGESTDASAELRRRQEFRDLYDLHFHEVHSYCNRRAASPQDAEDAVAETWSIAWRKLDQLPAGEGALPWLYAVARNTIRTSWRKRDRVSALTEKLQQFSAGQPHVADPADHSSDQAALVVEAMESLRRDDAELLRLLVWEGLSHASAAIILGCTENAVAIRLLRARKRLTSELLRRGVELPRELLPRSQNQESQEILKGPAPSDHRHGDGRTSPIENGPDHVR